MKKLALVTLLAVAASWLLSEARRPGPPPPSPMPVRAWAIEHPTPSGSMIRTVPWRKADSARLRRLSSGSSANPMPSWFPKSEIEEEAKARPDASGSRVLVGRLSASEDRARQDLRKTLEREVTDWIAADVPPTWKPPASAIDAMVQGSYVQQVTRSLKPSAGEPAPEAGSPSTPEVPGLDDLYTLHRAGQKLDFSPGRRAQFVEMYRHDLATWRMRRLGGGLALALVGLAVMAGYIRADEATRGYYTNRLRLAAAAGLGAAGVAAYRFLA